MDGLQPWAKTELKRRRVQNLADALAEAESLVDYSNHKESTSKPKDQNEGQGKVWRDMSPRKVTHRDNTPLRHQESSSWKGKAKDAQGLRKPSSSKCFICDGDHWARQCPQRQALSSLLARYQEENDVDGCQEGAHIGSLQLLNGIQSTPKIETKGLLFVDVAINGKATRAMVDTGIEFLDQVKAIPMPFVNAISITEGNQACVVPMIRGTKQESKVSSALQLEEEDTNRESFAAGIYGYCKRYVKEHTGCCSFFHNASAAVPSFKHRRRLKCHCTIPGSRDNNSTRLRCSTSCYKHDTRFLFLPSAASLGGGLSLFSTPSSTPASSMSSSLFATPTTEIIKAEIPNCPTLVIVSLEIAKLLSVHCNDPLHIKGAT
ncbi:hypothetical protein V6N13_044785 [Hibiscus sabdariffa]